MTKGKYVTDLSCAADDIAQLPDRKHIYSYVPPDGRWVWSGICGNCKEPVIDIVQSFIDERDTQFWAQCDVCGNLNHLRWIPPPVGCL